MSRPLFDLQPEERKEIIQILKEGLDREARILFAYLHGSFVEERPFHDIDVAVYLEDGVEHPLDLALDLALTLEGLLLERTGHHLEVDVRVLNRAPLGFCYHVSRGVLLLSRDDDRRCDWVVRNVSRYLDILPLQLQALKEAMGSWA